MFQIFFVIKFNNKIFQNFTEQNFIKQKQSNEVTSEFELRPTEHG